LNEYSDISLYSEIAESFNIEKIAEYPLNQPVVIFRINREQASFFQALGNDPEKWLQDALFAIKNDRLPSVTLAFPSTGNLIQPTFLQSSKKTAEDLLLEYAYYESIANLMKVDPSDQSENDSFSLFHNLTPASGQSGTQPRDIRSKNGYLTFSVANWEQFRKIEELIVEFLRSYSKNVYFFPLPSEINQDRQLAIRFYLKEIYGESMNFFLDLKNNILVIDDLNPRIDSQYQRMEFEIPQHLTEVTPEKIKQYHDILVQYYKSLCREPDDPISKQDFQDMSLSELTEIIIGYDQNGKYQGRPHCFEKNVLGKIQPTGINPMTRRPFSEVTLNQIALTDLAKAGLFDIGPFRGMISSDNPGLRPLAPGGAFAPLGVIQVEKNLDGDFLYFLDRSDGRRQDLFVRKSPPAGLRPAPPEPGGIDLPVLDLNHFNDIWSSGILHSNWAKHYWNHSKKISYYPLERSVINLLVSNRGKEFLDSLTI
jgi:hypothetical protein